MASRFVDAGSVEDFILQKTQRDVKLLQLFLVHNFSILWIYMA